MKKSFLGLKKIVINNRFDPIVEKNLTKQALQFNKLKTFKKCFKSWKFWIFGTLKLKQMNEKKAFLFRKKRLLQTLNSFLKHNMEVNSF